MNDMLCRSWWMPALRGIVAISFGLIALLWPGLTLLGLITLFAVYAVLGGAISIAAAVRYRKTHDDWWMPLLFGTTALGAGIIAIIHPALSIMVLVLLIGAHAMISGILDIAMAIRLRKVLHDEWLLALTGTAAVLFGVLAFLFPGAGALAIVWMISIYALATGMLLLALAFRLFRLFRLRSTAAKTAGISGTVIRERRIQPDRRMAHAH